MNGSIDRSPDSHGPPLRPQTADSGAHHLLLTGPGKERGQPMNVLVATNVEVINT